MQLDSPVEEEKLDNDEACEDPEPHECEGDLTQMEHNLTKEDVEVPTNSEDIERMSSPAPREEVKLDNDEACEDSEPHECEGDLTQMEHNLTKEDVEVPTNNEDIERVSSPAPKEEADWEEAQPPPSPDAPKEEEVKLGRGLRKKFLRTILS